MLTNSLPAAAGVAAAHERRNRGVLAGAERRLLVGIAGRLPRAITSDHLSLVGLGCMLLAGASFVAFRVTPLAGLLVVAALAGNWFGDSLDGTVARVREQQRPRYGFYVDHVIDIAGVSLLVGGMAASGLMDPVLALVVLAAFLLVCAEAYLGAIADRAFTMSFVGFGPTELRLVLAAGALKAMGDPSVSLGAAGTWRLFDVGGAVAAGGLIAAFVVSAVRRTIALYRAEPIPSFDRPAIGR